MYRRYYLYDSSHDSGLHNVTAATIPSEFGLQHVTCECMTWFQALQLSDGAEDRRKQT